MTIDQITGTLKTQGIEGYEFISFNGKDVWTLAYTEEDWERPWPVMVVHTGSLEDEAHAVVFIMGIFGTSAQRPSEEDLAAYLADNEQGGNWGSYALHQNESGEYSIVYAVKYRQKDLTEDALWSAVGWIANYCHTFHA